MKAALRRSLSEALLFALLLAVMLLWRMSAEASEDVQVSIDNFAFTPDALTVKAGMLVAFINHDDIPHSIVATDGAFLSRALDTDERFEFTFSTPGEFVYFCGLHPHMTAKIKVLP